MQSETRSESEDGLRALRLIFALTAGVLGLVAVFWILNSVYGAVSGKSVPQLVRVFEVLGASERRIVFEGHSIELPAIALKTTGWLICAVFLSIAAAVAYALLQAAARTLVPDITHLMERLERHMRKTAADAAIAQARERDAPRC